jgi:hypothetical protein
MFASAKIDVNKFFEASLLDRPFLFTKGLIIKKNVCLGNDQN